MSSERPLLIFGAGGLALDVLDTARAAGRAVAGFVVDQPDQPEALAGLPVHQLDALPAAAARHEAVGGIGSPKRRPFIERAEARGVRFVALVHPSAVVPASVDLAPGVVIGAGGVVAAAAAIGRHVYVNRGAMIGHHTRIGAWCSIGPGANIAGHVAIGEETEVGIGAVIIDRIGIGARCFVGAGALVTHNFSDGQMILGSPARSIRRR